MNTWKPYILSPLTILLSPTTIAVGVGTSDDPVDKVSEVTWGLV